MSSRIVRIKNIEDITLVIHVLQKFTPSAQ